MTWTAGYPTEIEYTYGYYRELCPSFLRLACLSAGIATTQADPLRRAGHRIGDHGPDPGRQRLRERA
jgi:hypothetical protein